jgi:hypothetical protein
MVLGGIVVSLASMIGLRLQRQLDGQAARFATAEQLAAGAEVLPIDLRGVSPGADIPIGGARDTSLEVRAMIGTAVVCGGTPGTVTLAFHRGPSGQPIAPRAGAGDTLWLLDDADDAERWRPVALSALRRAPGPCTTLDASMEDVVDRSHPWIADIHDSGSVESGSAARLTRPERYSFYRASDGQWYLGLRSWNSAAGAFNGVQPISGPYRSPTAPHGVRFRYFDGSGVLVQSGSSDPRVIARIEALLARDAPEGNGATDSLAVVIGLRNR